MLFKKYEHNPILKPEKANGWESLAVCNPAAWYENGTFYLLYRGAGDDEGHKIQIGLATSQDGFRFRKISEQSGSDSYRNNYDEGCCEDRASSNWEASITLPMPSGPLCPAGIGKANLS